MLWFAKHFSSRLALVQIHKTSVYNSLPHDLFAVYFCACLFIHSFHHPRRLVKFQTWTWLFCRFAFYFRLLSSTVRKTNEWHKSNKTHKRTKCRINRENDLCDFFYIFISYSVLGTSFTHVGTVGMKKIGTQFNLFNASIRKFSNVFRSEALKIPFDVYVFRSVCRRFF